MAYTRKIRHMLRRAFKDLIDSKSGYDRCSENATLRAILDKYTEDGQIGIIVSGMDCDCSQYYREYVRESFSCVAAFRRRNSPPRFPARP